MIMFGEKIQSFAAFIYDLNIMLDGQLLQFNGTVKLRRINYAKLKKMLWDGLVLSKPKRLSTKSSNTLLL